MLSSVGLIFLSFKGIVVTRKSSFGEYIEAVASIETWEVVLQTEFYMWKSNAIHHPPIHRAEFIKLPTKLQSHISHVFNAIDFPHLQISHKPKSSKLAQSTTTSPVTLAVLNQRFRMSTNLADGNSGNVQQVLSLGTNSFSSRDISSFFKANNISTQAVIDPNKRDNNGTCLLDDCGEGDFSLEYIMAIAQKTATDFSWQSGVDQMGNSVDPILQWVLNVTSQKSHPQTVLISFNADEVRLEPFKKYVYNKIINSIYFLFHN